MAQITRSYDDAKLWKQLKEAGLTVEDAVIDDIETHTGAGFRTSSVSVTFTWGDVPDALLDKALSDSLQE